MTSIEKGKQCSVCSNNLVSQESTHRLDCKHAFCPTCFWEMTTGRPVSNNCVAVECPQCHVKSRVEHTTLPAPPKSMCGEFADLSLEDSDMDEFDWDEETSPTPGASASIPLVAGSSEPSSQPTSLASQAQVTKFQSLLRSAEKKIAEKMAVSDAEKIAEASLALEQKTAKYFTAIVDSLRSATHQVFDEAQLLVDKKLDYMRKSSNDLDRRCSSKAEAIASMRKLISEMSFFNTSNSEATCLFKKVAKLHDEISNLNGVTVPFGQVQMTPAAEQFFASYSRQTLGTFDKMVRQTPIPPAEKSQPPKLSATWAAPNEEKVSSTPSPAEMKPQQSKQTTSMTANPPTVSNQLRDQNMFSKPSAPLPPKSTIQQPVRAPSAPLVKSGKLDENVPPFTPAAQTPKSAAVVSESQFKFPSVQEKFDSKSAQTSSSMTSTALANCYSGDSYSRMNLFAMITSLGDADKRSFVRPVGIAAFPSDKRQVAVVHTGHRISVFTASANLVGTYVLGDPDGVGRVQLVGDIAIDNDGVVYVLDRDHLPSRIFSFCPAAVPREANFQVVPKLFTRFSGRVRIYGLAVSSAKQMLYTSTRDVILAFGLRSGAVAFQCELRNPPSAYIHSLFDGQAPFVVFTAEEGRSIHRKQIVTNGNLESTTQIVSGRRSNQPISLVRRTACDPVGNILGADSGNKEIRVFALNGDPIGKFSPPASYGSAFSPSGIAVIPAHPNPSSVMNTADRCTSGKIHLGPVVVVPDFERHRVLFFDVPS